MNTGDGFGRRWGRNDEFCVAAGVDSIRRTYRPVHSTLENRGGNFICGEKYVRGECSIHFVRMLENRREANILLIRINSSVLIIFLI